MDADAEVPTEGETITPEMNDSDGNNNGGGNDSNSLVPVEDSLRMDNRSYECDVCFMKFTQFANMRRHKLSHSGIRPFECRLCSRRFFRKDHLVEHTVRKHSKQRPLRCPFCAKTFPTVPLLKCHLSNAHSSGYNPKDNVCSICNFVASTPGGAKIHYMTYHVRRAIGPTSPPNTGLSALLGHYPSQQTDATGNAVETYRPVSLGEPYQELSPRITDVRSHQEDAEEEGAVVVKTEAHNAEEGEARTTQEVPGSWPTAQSSDQPSGAGIWGAAPGNDLGIVVSPPPRPSGSFGAEEKSEEKQRSTPETSTADGDSGVDVRCPAAFSCHYCDVVFYDRTLYLLHRGMHSLHRPWRCNLCGHLCKHRYDFASHIIAHSHA